MTSRGGNRAARQVQRDAPGAAALVTLGAFEVVDLEGWRWQS